MEENGIKNNIYFAVIITLSLLIPVILGPLGFNIVFSLFLLFLFVYPELVFALFCAIGTLKGSGFVAHFPIDFTLLSALLCGIYGASFFLRPKIINFNFNFIIDFFIFLQFLLVALHIFYSNIRPEILFRQGYRFLMYVACYFLFKIVLTWGFTNAKLNKVIKGTAILYAAYCGVALHNYLFDIDITNGQYSVTYISAYGESYMIMGKTIYFLLLYLLIKLVLEKRLIFIYLPVLFTSFFIFINSPSRGVLINGFLFFFTFFILKFGKKTIPYFAILTIILIAASPFIYDFLNSSDQTKRLLEVGSDDSSVIRLMLFKTAIDLFLANPIFGGGIGKVAEIHNDPGLYTHNLILEIFGEFGIIGFICFGIPIIISLFFCIKMLRSAITAKDINKTFVLLFFLFLTFFSLSSGTIGEMRDFWLLWAAVSFYYSYKDPKFISEL